MNGHQGRDLQQIVNERIIANALINISDENSNVALWTDSAD